MKNVTRVLVMICVLAVSNMFGQATPQEVTFQTTENNVAQKAESHYLLADKVYLRDCASTLCARRGKLDIGTKLTVLEKDIQTETLEGITSSWYKVKTDTEIGWLWGGFIAQKAFGSEANGNVKFVFGSAGIQVNEDGVLEQMYQIRAFRNDMQIRKFVFKSNEDIDVRKVKSIGSKGLTNVRDIIKLHIPCEEDANKSGDIYVFWNGNDFYEVATLKGSEKEIAGTYEKFIFPSDMSGERNMIIRKSSKVADEEYEGYDDDVIKRVATNVFLKWDGTQLVETVKEPVIINYEIKN